VTNRRRRDKPTALEQIVGRDDEEDAAIAPQKMRIASQ
jgi:hypothetical protein